MQSSECPLIQACNNQKCIDPCPGTCGIGAICHVVNHNPVCSCPDRFTGDPFVRCLAISMLLETKKVPAKLISKILQLKIFQKRILVSHPPAVPIHNVELLTIPHPVHVWQNTLARRRIVDLNASVIANARQIWLALIRNVKIHVRELAE